MMKSMKAKLMILVALFAFSAVTVAACGGKKEDKEKAAKKTDDKAKAGGDEAKAGGDEAKAGGDKAAADADVCAKAKTCLDAWVKADAEGAKNVQSAWKYIETLEGDQKIEQCKQLIQGAGFNPKAPPECK